jgi:hypothetical protein
MATFNGAPNGQIADYGQLEDPTTDIPASGMNPLMASVAAGTHTAIRAFCNFTYNGTSCVVNFHDSNWGNALAVVPVVARTATGTFTVTFPSTVQDLTLVNQNPNLRDGWLEVKHQGFTGYITCSSNVATVNVFDSSSKAAADPTNYAVSVYVL